MATYDLTPVDVPHVETKYRTIRTKIPVPESLPIFEELQRVEPRSMMGQPPVVWHKAEDFIVADNWGNRWIDWSSCVLVSNAGHGRPEIKDALKKIIDQGLARDLRLRPRAARRALQDAPGPLARPGELPGSSCSAPAARRPRTASSSPRPTPSRSTAAAEEVLRLVPERLPRPHDGRAARRRHGRS